MNFFSSVLSHFFSSSIAKSKSNELQCMQLIKGGQAELIITHSREAWTSNAIAKGSGLRRQSHKWSSLALPLMSHMSTDWERERERCLVKVDYVPVYLTLHALLVTLDEENEENRVELCVSCCVYNFRGRKLDGKEEVEQFYSASLMSSFTSWMNTWLLLGSTHLSLSLFRNSH